MRLLLERALLPSGVADDVVVEIEDGRFTAVMPDVGATGDVDRVPGLTLPGLANTHSHAFHRALRGRTQQGRGSFWTWRDQMYAVAGRLDPDTCFALARATYREMLPPVTPPSPSSTTCTTSPTARRTTTRRPCRAR